MAKANVFLLSIVLMASLASLSHGLLINNLQIGTLNVTGLLTCSLTGDLSAPPLSAATVVLTCGGSSTDLGQATTDPLGVFTIVANILQTVLFNPSTCLVTVQQLPVGTCSVFTPDSVVASTISLAGVTLTNVGNIANFITNGFLRR